MSTTTKTIVSVESVTSQTALDKYLTATEVEELISDFTKVKDAMKKLTEEKESIDKAIRSLLGKSESGTINGVERVRIEHRSREFVDMEILKKDFSEVYEKTKKTTLWTFIKTL